MTVLVTACESKNKIFLISLLFDGGTPSFFLFVVSFVSLFAFSAEINAWRVSPDVSRFLESLLLPSNGGIFVIYLF